jgi:hypothetical protein
VSARLPQAAVAAPPLLLALAAAALLGLAALGVQPLWPTPEVTPAEAAALGDDVALVRLARAGADIDRASLVRAGMLGAAPLALSPLDASIASRELRTLRTLLKLGASLDGDRGRLAACLAQNTDFAEAASLLASRGFAAGGRCADVRVPWPIDVTPPGRY